MEGPVTLIALLSLLLAVKTGFVGAAIWFDRCYPTLSGRMLKTYQTRSRRCFFVGLINVFGGVFLVVLLLQLGPLALLGLALGICLIGLAVIGYGVAYHELGLHFTDTDSFPSETVCILRGGLVAETTFMAPILGQILSLSYLFRGLGAVTLTLLSRGPRTQTAAQASIPDSRSPRI